MLEAINNKRILISAGIVLGLVGAVVAVIPLFQSMHPTETQRELFAKQIRLDEIKPGVFSIIKFADRPVIVVRPDQEMLRDLRGLNSHVWGPSISSTEAPHVFVYVGVSTFRGCGVWHRPKGHVDMGPEWKGGWIDPCHMGAWDYAGRTLRDVNVPAGRKLENLPKQDFRFLEEGIVELQR
jgi:ubiquinol-cytochrome c reductase iron-sulfur subunit